MKILGNFSFVFSFLHRDTRSIVLIVLVVFKKWNQKKLSHETFNACTMCDFLKMKMHGFFFWWIKFSNFDDVFCLSNNYSILKNFANPFFDFAWLISISFFFLRKKVFLLDIFYIQLRIKISNCSTDFFVILSSFLIFFRFTFQNTCYRIRIFSEHLIHFCSFFF